MIEVDHLSKHYGSVKAVDDVSFAVPAGRVVGFLGPNGAGKSTAMRCLTGLSTPTAGTARVLGRPYRDLANPATHVGVLLDASAQHAGRTGTEVLTLAAQLIGAPAGRVNEMLSVVGLSPKEAKRRIGGYSLGMRQRLGIAHALLGDPEVLVLDEPANGLDPGGIRWMRDLLRAFADQGGAVLLSSHLLNEVELVADDLVVIGHGRIVAQGSKAELLRTSGTTAAPADPTERGALAAALQAAGMACQEQPGGALRVEGEAARVGRVALDARIALGHLTPAGSAGLEDLFLQLTQDTAREGHAA